MRVREIRNDLRIEDAINCGICPNTDRKSEQRSEREAGLPEQQAAAEAKVAPDIPHSSPLERRMSRVSRPISA
jgi:hypothetical protein